MTFSGRDANNIHEISFGFLNHFAIPVSEVMIPVCNCWLVARLFMCGMYVSQGRHTLRCPHSPLQMGCNHNADFTYGELVGRLDFMNFLNKPHCLKPECGAWSYA